VTAPATIWKATLDCVDLGVTTAFWTWVLGLDVTYENANIRFLGLPDGPPIMCLQQVEEPRSGKNRMHLDLLVDDLDEMSEQVQQRGGDLLAGPHDNPAGRWSVMADPEGNEFCLVMLTGGELP
jgi:predicted enzyme related to lactoylglutathione lyase